MKQKNIGPGGSLNGFFAGVKHKMALLVIFVFSLVSALGSLSYNTVVQAATSGSTSEKTSASKIELVELPAKSPTDTAVIFSAKAVDVKDLFVYGLEITYDPVVLTYKKAAAGHFLSQEGKTTTSFQAALENGVAGKLIVAEARTGAGAKTGVSGTGELFTMDFELNAGSKDKANTKVQFGKNSFAATSTADLKTEFDGMTLSLKLDSVKNLKSAHGTERYGLSLTWDAQAGATDYKVYRKNQHGEWKLLKEVSTTSLTDNGSGSGSSALIPHLDYVYRVVALKGTKESPVSEIIGKDTRGLKGDNNRSDRVDGRDLEKLARAFGQLDTEKDFDPLIDTTYDGRIDGNDLIDLGLNFAKVFKP